MQNWIGIIVSFAFVFSVIFVAKWVEKYGKEASRKTVHIAVSNWWILAMIFFKQPLWAAIVPACFVILNYISYRYQIFGAMEREEDQGKGDLGTVYYAVSLLVLALLTFGDGKDPIVGAVGILVMGYGDGFAALLGKRYPKGKYRIFGATKSMTGNITMFSASFAVLLILFATTGQATILLPALVIAVLATVIEAVTPLGLDNLSVPLLASLAFAVIF
ncbi:MAG: SEC59/DGK1/VTE5 family protein [Eubacteriales bacterium]|nr:SEC59/DGK1/VTE5 family protein [Eubacteriales bacterium]